MVLESTANNIDSDINYPVCIYAWDKAIVLSISMYIYVYVTPNSFSDLRGYSMLILEDNKSLQT